MDWARQVLDQRVQHHLRSLEHMMQLVERAKIPAHALMPPGLEQKHLMELDRLREEQKQQDLFADVAASSDSASTWPPAHPWCLYGAHDWLPIVPPPIGSVDKDVWRASVLRCAYSALVAAQRRVSVFYSVTHPRATCSSVWKHIPREVAQLIVTFVLSAETGPPLLHGAKFRTNSCAPQQHRGASGALHTSISVGTGRAFVQLKIVNDHGEFAVSSEEVEPETPRKQDLVVITRRAPSTPPRDGVEGEGAGGESTEDRLGERATLIGVDRTEAILKFQADGHISVFPLEQCTLVAPCWNPSVWTHAVSDWRHPH